MHLVRNTLEEVELSGPLVCSLSSSPLISIGSSCPLTFPLLSEHCLYVVILVRNRLNSKSLIPFDNQSGYAGLYLETAPGPKMCQDLLTFPRARIPNLGLSTLGKSSNRNETRVIRWSLCIGAIHPKIPS